MEGIYYDIVFAIASTLMFILYHGYLVYKVYKDPVSTVIGFNHITRRSWVEVVMTCGKDILAVQSLRNNIMGSSLLATASILLATTMSGFAANPATWNGHDAVAMASNALNQNLAPIFQYLEKNIIHVKFFTLILAFIICFFCYLQSIRLYNHANCLINIPTSHESPLLGYVCRLLAKASNFYTAGTRFLYFALLLLIWLFHPICMFICTIILLIVVSMLDITDRFDRSITLESHNLETIISSPRDRHAHSSAIDNILSVTSTDRKDGSLTINSHLQQAAAQKEHQYMV